jgi:small subunit ribosomal protein S6
MRDYELMAVFPTEDEQREAGKQKVQADFDANGVVVDKVDDLGDRELAYEVQKRRRGHYVLYTMKAEPAKIAVMDVQFKLNNNLLKYLFVRK